MRIILIDDYGAREKRLVGPGDVIRVEDTFAPCDGCGKVVLLRDFMPWREGHDMECRHCHEREAAQEVQPGFVEE